MKNASLSFRFIGGFSVLILGSALILATAISRGPDLQLSFERRIPSALPPERIQRSIESPMRWPQWFHSLGSASIVDLPQDGVNEIREGQLVILNVDPNKGPRRRFSLTAQVSEYQPGRVLELQVLKDSSGRLTRMFDDLRWKIQIEPKDSGSILRGTVTAHTAHWKSRLFGRIAEKIILHQVFYPNLIQLSELKQPFSADPQVLESLQGSRSSIGF